MNAKYSLKNGSVGADVRQLQTHLNTQGFEVERDGWFGDNTEAAVIAFQRRVGLVADGVAGPKTMAALQTGGASPIHLKQSDIEDAASQLDVPVAAVMAISEVETRGSGFLDDGRPVILFERHVFYRLLKEAGEDADMLALRYPNIINPKRGGYAGGAAEHSRLRTAMEINQLLAPQAASWGRYQIMGFHWYALGYEGPEAFVAAMCTSEAEHLAAFIRFIEADGPLHKALKGKKWADFAKIYNGPAYKDNAYDTKLQRAYARYVAMLEGSPVEDEVA
jgi:hypothetical protein